MSNNSNLRHEQLECSNIGNEENTIDEVIKDFHPSFRDAYP